MQTLSLSGSLPGTIVENTAPWEWAGTLRLNSDPAQVRFVEIEGLAGNFFEVTLDRRTGVITISPSARLDAEWFAANGLSTTLTLNLRFYMTDGTQAAGNTSYTVQVVGVDDTPPLSLAFASGGSARANLAGAEIGRLAVTDPDTASGFTFRLSDDDAWQFEVVNGVLRLRAGVSLSLADGPQRSVTIIVSDGRQESAFTLEFDVLPSTGGSDPIDYMVRGSAKAGMAWANESVVAGYVPAWELRSVGVTGNLVSLTREDGQAVWFNRPDVIELSSGWIEFRPNSEAGWLWLIWETMLDRAPTLSEYQEGVSHLMRWARPVDLVSYLLTSGEAAGSCARMSQVEFVREIYANVVSWDIGQDVINWHARRLEQGLTTRSEFVMSVVEWRSGTEEFLDLMAEGVYVPRRHMAQLGALLDAIGGWDMGDYVWEWFMALESGAGNIRGLAVALRGTEAYQQRWGQVSDRDFFIQVAREVWGFDLTDGQVTWWQWVTQAGWLTRADFVAAVVENLPSTSQFRDTPTGAAFDAVW